MGFQGGFRINTNTSAVNTYRSYSSAQAGLERNIERLSSGMRINRAADDSAGLAISQRMNNQVRGMQQANRNDEQGHPDYEALGRRHLLVSFIPHALRSDGMLAWGSRVRRKPFLSSQALADPPDLVPQEVLYCRAREHQFWCCVYPV